MFLSTSWEYMRIIPELKFYDGARNQALWLLMPLEVFLFCFIFINFMFDDFWWFLVISCVESSRTLLCKNGPPLFTLIFFMKPEYPLHQFLNLVHQSKLNTFICTIYVCCFVTHFLFGYGATFSSRWKVSRLRWSSSSRAWTLEHPLFLCQIVSNHTILGSD